MVSKDELVDQFVAVTGSDKDTASHILEACSNNLDHAVATFLDNGVSTSSRNTVNGKKSEDNVRAPIPQTQGVLVEDFPPLARYSSRRGRSIFEGFNSFESNENGKQTSKKLKKLEELFRPPIDMMYEGTFQSARDEAIKENKWLMVNIQNIGEFSCQVLNRDVWSDKKVKNLVKKNFLFWQETNDSHDGDRFMTFYNVTQWPHISILDPRTGGRLTTLSNVTTVTKEIIVEQINDFLEVHGTDLNSETNGKNTKDCGVLSLNEEEQLAAAIAASLRETETVGNNSSGAGADDTIGDDNSIKPKSSSSSQNINESASKQNDVSENSKTKKVLRKIFPAKKRKSNSMPFVADSPSKMSKCDETDDGEFVVASDVPNNTPSSPYASNSSPAGDLRLLLRHADGKREEIKLRTNSTVKDLLSVVSKSYDMRSFEVVKNFPRKTISRLPHTQTLAEAGVVAMDTVFIQEKL